MGTKLKPARFDCYANALPDEPMFILLARDASASGVVKLWAMERLCEISQGRRPESDRPMVEEARQCAKDMAEWRSTNYGKWRNVKPPPKPTAGLDAIANPIASAVADVIRERSRQITQEGHTQEHDDTLVNGEIADAGLAYVINSDPNADGKDQAFQLWPFKGEPPLHDRRRALVCGAALFIAEIERLDRLAASSKAEPSL